MTAHEDPDHGKGHCHHEFVTQGCNPCHKALPNTELKASLNRQEYAELAEFGDQIRRWAQEQRIEDVPRTFKALQGASRTVEVERDDRARALEMEVDAHRQDLARAMAGLQEAVSRIPKRRRGGFEGFYA